MRFKRDDHLTSMLENVPGDLRNKPGIEALLGAFAVSMNEVEQTFYDVSIERNLDLASGAALDILGNRVLEQRRDLGDPEYRRVIRAKILALKSDHTVDAILGVAEALLGGSGYVTYLHTPPAAYQLTVLSPLVTGASDTFRTTFRRLIERATAPGVGVGLFAGPLTDVIRTDTDPSTPLPAFTETAPPGFAQEF